MINTDDNDALPGFLVSAPSSSVTTGGGTITFTVTLTKAPTSNVVIPIYSSNTTEGAITDISGTLNTGTSSITFSSSTWNTAVTVTVTGQDDNDGNNGMAYAIVLSSATSSDVNYNGLDPQDISLTNTD